ncbi:hypothetical protein I5G81_gp01 [Mycobacterium phage Shandong1]|uniref:Uncharacterized protein n=1 Tax=Mycobacterium phage Shandong1 TaxID=1983447 RepID=A0A1X9SHF9_9CAUD|nr:hypothetical protein I5G81_gp01 [Mycobacterium phage Shandong1]ARQ95440.1 hypothetical protein [Mycobacterium phage Shandong1]
MIAVIAQRVEVARSIARKLRIPERDVVHMSARTVRNAARGHVLDALVLDDDAELTEADLDVLAPAMARGCEVFRLQRISLPPPF